MSVGTLIAPALLGVVFVSFSLAALAEPAADAAAKAEKPASPARPERTSFQTSRAWDPAWDIRTDVAMVYGIDPGLPGRLKTWIDRGYVPQVMTGVSWGEYQDYLYGRFDGKNHGDAAQQRKDGTKVSHGGDVYYMVPEENFGKFLSVGVKRAIDAGAQAIYLEEPEFWSFSGWSPAFQREWKAYYKEDWQAPDSSPEARYRSGQLKYYLYKRALAQVFAFVNDYGKQIGREVKCYVPTHSMLNYASWGIVSPESSLAALPGCDGYIAQVWTGTARTPNAYNGVKRERTFETAFCEYGQMHNLVRATGRRMIFLADPIEDNADHSWVDYKTNYEQTLVASLLWPDVTHFEVVPWPERVFRGEYPKVDVKQRKAGEPVEKEKIPAAYATELMRIFETLKDMDQEKVEWHTAAHGVGVLVSDTLMFHRGGPDDPGGDLSHVYGQMLPLLKRGVAVQPVQLENAALEGYLKPYKVLYLTYDGQKPMDEKPHAALAQWVKDGGVLVLSGKPDAFANVRAWWNTGEDHFADPADHLRKTLGLPAGVPAEDTVTPVGKGFVLQTALEPRAVAENGKADLDHFMRLTGTAFGKAGLKTDWSNALWLRRGPYVVGAVMEESVSQDPLRLKGKFLDLFSGKPLPDGAEFRPGQRFLLLDLDRVSGKPQVVAAASQIADLRVDGNRMTFRATGPVDVYGETFLRLTGKPKQVSAKGADGSDVPDLGHGWFPDLKLATVDFPNSPEGVTVTVDW